MGKAILLVEVFFWERVSELVDNDFVYNVLDKIMKVRYMQTSVFILV